MKRHEKPPDQLNPVSITTVNWSNRGHSRLHLPLSDVSIRLVELTGGQMIDSYQYANNHKEYTFFQQAGTSEQNPS